MRKPVVFWRLHAKPSRAVKPRRLPVAMPEYGTGAYTKHIMAEIESHTADDGVGAVHFNFTANDVETLFNQHRSEGSGLWFLLKDGRVFNHLGEYEGRPENPYAVFSVAEPQSGNEVDSEKP